jgi:anti-anti-sigma factor
VPVSVPVEQEEEQAAPVIGGLQLGLRKRRAAVELTLAGELDLVTAPRLLAAMEWLRRRYRHVIVVDTRDLEFVDLAGYRAFDACLRDPADGERDPRVVYVVGDALAHLQSILAAITGSGSPRLS